MTGVKHFTQYKIIKRWLERGKRVMSFHGLKSRKRVLNPE
jgi:hypothetical protein